MPGALDKVSIATNVYEQKGLFICTLKELYQSFKGRNPGIKVGFSTLDFLHFYIKVEVACFSWICSK